MSITVITEKKDRAVTLEPKAAEKVAEFVAAQGAGEETFLRLGVRGGGCSGFQYQLALDNQRDGDEVFESEGQRILVGRDSMPYVAGSRIIWTETLMTSGFDVENPNATAACGCGSSFRVDEGAAGCSEAADIDPEDVYL